MIKRDNPKVFIDSSVLIVAVLSNTGASNIIFRLSEKRIIKIIMTESVLKEAKRSLLSKYGENSISKMLAMLVCHKGSIVDNADVNVEQRFVDLIEDKNDLHILAGAEENTVDYLITFDRKHFMTSKLEQANLSFKILLPGDFLAQLRLKLKNDI